MIDFVLWLGRELSVLFTNDATTPLGWFFLIWVLWCFVSGYWEWIISVLHRFFVLPLLGVLVIVSLVVLDVVIFAGEKKGPG